jgi:hypothetical protein
MTPHPADATPYSADVTPAGCKGDADSNACALASFARGAESLRHDAACRKCGASSFRRDDACCKYGASSNVCSLASFARGVVSLGPHGACRDAVLTAPRCVTGVDGTALVSEVQMSGEYREDDKL